MPLHGSGKSAGKRNCGTGTPAWAEIAPREYPPPLPAQSSALPDTGVQAEGQGVRVLVTGPGRLGRPLLAVLHRQGMTGAVMHPSELVKLNGLLTLRELYLPGPIWNPGGANEDAAEAFKALSTASSHVGMPSRTLY